MKPGGICKKSGKRAYGSHEEAVRKAAHAMFELFHVTEFRSYTCRWCKCWHVTKQAKRQE